MTDLIKDMHTAMDLMRRPGAHLIQTNGRFPQWWIGPCGERIDPKIAEQIKAHPQVKGDEDSLWPGMSQTWRVR